MLNAIYDFEKGEAVRGKVCGIFEIERFDSINRTRGAWMKELNPSTGERGPHPELFMPFGTFKKMDGPAEQTLENAWLIHIEMHVGNDTRHLHQVVYAETELAARVLMDDLKPDYRGNNDPSYQLQVKSGPWKLTEHHSYLTEY